MKAKVHSVSAMRLAFEKASGNPPGPSIVKALKSKAGRSSLPTLQVLNSSKKSGKSSKQKWVKNDFIGLQFRSGTLLCQK